MLASDLNPDAVELLLDNLRRWDRRDYPTEPKKISRLHEDRIVGVADATKLHEDPSISGAWDLLLVNLPHRTVELLLTLIPLLDRTGTSMIRGRVIAAESEIEDVNEVYERFYLLGYWAPPSQHSKSSEITARHSDYARLRRG